MTAAAAVPLTRTRRCRLCHSLHEQEAVADARALVACPRCACAQVPYHGDWPRDLKQHLLALALATHARWRYAPKTFFPLHRSKQVSWEYLLRDAYNGIRDGHSQPNPHPFRNESGAADIYVYALERADRWAAAERAIATQATPQLELVG